MKNILVITITFVIAGCFGKSPVVKTGLEGKTLPSFDLLLLDSSTHFNTTLIPTGKPFILLSFATWCPYCKVQTEELINVIDNFSDINIYMITTSQLSDVKKFSKQFNLRNYKNITIGIDYSSYFAGYFQTNIVPYFAIYGSDRKLKQVLIGKSSINLISDIALSK